ncbi:MAG: glycosyltransferase family 4 protein [Bacillus sp. (in: Bacteria)]|nr:glycosyltransferase family 4 protein [Bacillus sp. (in: firmicutes)]
MRKIIKLKANIVHYTQQSRSGAALYVYHLIRALSHQEIKITLICPQDFDHLKCLNRLSNVHVFSVIPSIVGISGFIKKLCKMAKQAYKGFLIINQITIPRRSIVHVNFPGIIFTAVPLLWFCKLKRIKIILNVHDVLPHRWLLPKFLRFVEWTFLWAMYCAADRIVVHHSSQAKVLLVKFGIAQTKVWIIPHGTFNFGEGPKPYIKSNEMTVLLFGSLRENKGIHLAIKAIQELRAQGKSIRLLIAGCPSASEASYWQRCRELISFAPDGIEVIEQFIPNDELPNLIVRSHVFILPYTEFHSQSGVAAMAMSNGRAIIATHQGGLKELLIPGQTGLLISEPTVEAIKTSLYNALALWPEQLKIMGQEAYHYLRKNYSWEMIAKKYKILYMDMMLNKKY